MKKSIITVLLVTVMSFGLVACGGNAEVDAPESVNTESNQEAKAESENMDSSIARKQSSLQ